MLSTFPYFSSVKPNEPSSVRRRSSDRSATKQRILSAAETLFMQHGYEATSMRAITTTAGVNLAAVNYHFGSKEELFTQILTRRLDPMMAERQRLLDALQRQSDPSRAAYRVEQLIAAMFLPALSLARDPVRGGENFLKLLGRAFADPSPFVQKLLSERYQPVHERFKHAFAQALPELKPQTLSMRLHFLLDAIASTLASEDARRLIALHEASSTDGLSEEAAFLAHFAPFLAAGLRAEVDRPEQRQAIMAVQQFTQQTRA